MEWSLLFWAIGTPIMIGIVAFCWYGLTKEGPDGPWPFSKPW